MRSRKVPLVCSKDVFFTEQFALGNVPQEAITVQQYCDHPCGAAAQRWEQFRLLNQSVECQEGGKSTMDSILLHCLRDWFANGDAKVRTRDLKGFKMSVSWGFSGVDWWSRLFCRSFSWIFFFFYTEFKTTETRRSRKHWENQVGYENEKMLFCLTRWEPPSVAGTCASRRTKLTLILCCSKNRAKSTWKIQWLHVFRETMSWLVWIIHRLHTEQLLC